MQTALANFILFINMRDENGLYEGLESSTDFWNKKIDDKVWNDVY